MPEVSYVPGSMTAVVGDDCLALVDVKPESPVVYWIWQKFRERAPAPAILIGLLGSEFGGVRDFALVSGGDDGQPRVFCRGAASATVLSGEVSTRLDGTGMTTWSEHLVAPGAERIVIGEPPGDSVIRLPASNGVLLAECVIIDLAGLGDEALAAAAGTGSFPISAGFPVMGGGALPVAGDTVTDLASATRGNLPDTVTIPGSAASGAEPQPLPGLPDAPPQPPPRAPGSAVRSTPPSRLIDAVPWAVADREDGVAADAAAADGGDAGEATVRRADLVAPAARSALPPDRIGPVVAALVCAEGHANPPSSGACLRCGASLPQETVLIPRPVLGELRTSLGDVISLDRGVVMGRNPSADPDGADREERPHLLKLPPAGGEISRTHLRVTLDGWHVLLTDLNSTNGTMVALPGREPQQLPPGGQMPILPGTVVSLADGIDFRYEAVE